MGFYFISLIQDLGILQLHRQGCRVQGGKKGSCYQKIGRFFSEEDARSFVEAQGRHPVMDCSVCRK